MVVYSVLSALWVLVSILLLVPNICSKKGSRSSKCTFYPWILITALIVITDVINVIIYIMDITHTLVANDYLKFIGASGSWENVTGMAWKGQDTAAPAVAMTLFFSRIIIFWLLNLALLYRVIRKCKHHTLHNLPDVDNNMDKWEKPIIGQQRPTEQRSNAPLYLDPEPRNWKGVAQRRQQERPSNLHLSQPPTKVTYMLDEFGIPIEEVRSPRAENHLHYGGAGAEVPIIRPIREPGLLRRPSNRVAGQNMPPEELRGQVPWSYLRPPPPKASSPSSTSQMVGGPIIPAPDYGHRQQREYIVSDAATRK
ncbi:uncharacterized protein LOC111044325 [Nilaparvata lugens]|uniref:uncharacterized protein LOC111044325 n=1 Tax=Nilaparvata lugens TaxID=108931 RepID=UPI00193D0B40|nr:uncharacterized protein LOC111044325 [Nilaparvata lugens]